MKTSRDSFFFYFSRIILFLNMDCLELKTCPLISLQPLKKKKKCPLSFSKIKCLIKTDHILWVFFWLTFWVQVFHQSHKWTTPPRNVQKSPLLYVSNTFYCLCESVGTKMNGCMAIPSVSVCVYPTSMQISL